MLATRPASVGRSNQAPMNPMQRREKEQERRKRQKREGKGARYVPQHHVIAAIAN